MNHPPIQGVVVTPMFSTDEGRGQPLVFVHGWGADHQSWSSVRGYMTDRYRVIAVDLWGHGRSAAPPSAYTMRELAEGLYHTLGTLNLAVPPVLIGHSLGGMVVQQLAADHPEALLGMVLLDADLNPPVLGTMMAAVSRVSTWSMRLAAWGGAQRSSLADPRTSS